ncbi:pirin family protein [Nissabacter sp. SGAir0207]|uniref:pirin family protein n=1 Tax=Nissabacter sp. SGAir0207 TaxID=2126321 RepID=UPI0010CD4A82|nr:pirin family protein [Nissabacter sp. SGAir0207]QCR38502.1 nuclease PIN [Nissabacter sp. SGAir0207]
MSFRTLKQQHPALRDDIGDLVTRRPLPNAQLPQLDPFLFLNHHGPQVYPANNQGLPFGPHPHRGFETVTFILEGELAHLDSGGHESVINEGGIQWMTAGSGLVHAEISPASFKRSGGPLEILQLWVNLPARLKMTQPAYTGLQQADIPAIEAAEGLATVSLISGEFDGQQGPYVSQTGITMMTAQCRAGAQLTLPAPAGHTVFLYVVRGDLSLNGQALKPHHLIELNDEGDSVTLAASGEAVILYGHAQPFNEPVVSYGPFVMNSREEINQAIVDYQAGKFGDVTL